ncbi:protein-disulfide reductase DsbD family protein [Tsuneonella mangrovi]|uniref:protein-disulfide reductase DsbD family protein n=1 Tax=Tsuneonella mangrovi TaxID=1982042 RepID=UPI000BA1DD71|nr:protein-disulfide reductase DsbD domain-containing protein [Tsuneonella mangrovi]
MPRLLAFFVLLSAVLALVQPGVSRAQAVPHPNHIEADLGAASSQPGGPVHMVLHFVPEDGWHGYWSNPGDAGYGMQLDWKLPPGWTTGVPQYPVPQQLEIGGLMNHVYEGPYAVLVDLVPPPGAKVEGAQIGLEAHWLACTDSICVPEERTFSLRLPQVTVASADYPKWLATIPAELDQGGTFMIGDKALRIALPLPASLPLPDPHVFTDQRDLVAYAAPQLFRRDGNALVAEIPLAQTVAKPDKVSGILSLGDGNGVRFTASPGVVPAGGEVLTPDTAPAATGPLWILLLAALAGGLILNVMPCVFPILSLKALSLARAGESDAQARADGIAYTAGVLLATLALGALMLGLRAAGESVGWAFQLQEPGVVVALLVLAVAITANFAGLYELPSLSISRGGEQAGAFATGLLAAFVATPCTGPFMAAAMGAALLLPTAEAMLLFAALGLGLALPFLLLGFVPPLRRMLPKPGKWMETFRKAMAVPMGLTALALVWLVWRLTGMKGLAYAVLALPILLGALAAIGVSQRKGKSIGGVAAIATLVAIGMVVGLPRGAPPEPSAVGEIIPAKPFSEIALQTARAQGKPVFVWFTADWCLTCKVNESVAIEREETRDAFNKAGVVALVGDWTRRDPEITRFLTAHGAAGVPLYLWYAPGKDAEVLPQVLTPGMLVTLAGSARISAPGSSRSPANTSAPAD